MWKRLSLRNDEGRGGPALDEKLPRNQHGRCEHDGQHGARQLRHFTHNDPNASEVIGRCSNNSRVRLTVPTDLAPACGCGLSLLDRDATAFEPIDEDVSSLRVGLHPQRQLAQEH
jgi:hypothetical protein